MDNVFAVFRQDFDGAENPVRLVSLHKTPAGAIRAAAGVASKIVREELGHSIDELRDISSIVEGSVREGELASFEVDNGYASVWAVEQEVLD